MHSSVEQHQIKIDPHKQKSLREKLSEIFGCVLEKIFENTSGISTALHLSVEQFLTGPKYETHLHNLIINSQLKKGISEQI